MREEKKKQTKNDKVNNLKQRTKRICRRKQTMMISPANNPGSRGLAGRSLPRLQQVFLCACVGSAIVYRYRCKYIANCANYYFYRAKHMLYVAAKAKDAYIEPGKAGANRHVRHGRRCTRHCTKKRRKHC